MTKVPVNFRIDSSLLSLARARSEREGITLIALLERSLKAELEVSASAAPSDRISVEAIVDTVVNTVSTDIDRVKINLNNVEAFVKTIAESVNTIQAEVAGLSERLNLVSATVDTIVNTKTVVKSNVNTYSAIDDSVTSTAGSSQEWMNLSTIASMLQVLPKSISGAASKRGRDLGDDRIEFEVAGKKINKRGSGLKALYQIIG